MDNGNLIATNSKIMYINTYFKEFEVKKLINILNSTFDLNVYMLKFKEYFRIYIPNTNYEFSNLIKSFIIKSMLYKLPIS
jgi:hypothetical protein